MECNNNRWDDQTIIEVVYAVRDMVVAIKDLVLAIANK